MIPKLVEITTLEKALVNLALYLTSPKINYLRTFIKMYENQSLCALKYINDFKALSIEENKQVYDELFSENLTAMNQACRFMEAELIKCCNNLPRPLKTDYTKQTQSLNKSRAINQVTKYIRYNNCDEYYILHYNFSGYRNIDNSKTINAIHEVQVYMDALKKKYSCEFICGSTGADEFGALVFGDLDALLSFSEELVTSFASTENLRQICFRIGCAWGDSSIGYSKNDIWKTWVPAIECCNFLVDNFDYSSRLIAVENYLPKIKNIELSARFACGIQPVNGMKGILYQYTNIYRSPYNETLYLESAGETMKAINENPQSVYIAEKLSKKNGDLPTSATSNTIEEKSNTSQNGEAYNKTVLVVTALEKELQPVIDMFQFPLTLDRKNVNGVPHYILEAKGIRVVFTTMTKMGQLHSALSIKNTLSHFEVDSVILCGICAGLSKEVNFGDLIISEQIVDYEIAKIDSHGSNIRWNVYRSDYLLMTEMRNFDSNKWKQYVLNNFKEQVSSPPKIHCGTVLSGNKVIANEAEAGKLASIWHNAQGLEMEAAGMAAALYTTPNSPSFIMVKSVCDYADSNKNDEWQEYAAQTAAAFVVDFVLTILKDGKGLKIIKNNKINDYCDLRQENLNKLSFTMGTAYNIAEIKNLAFYLGIDFEDIAGNTKSEKIIELIRYCDRRKQLADLTNRINEERKNILNDIIWSSE